MPADPDAHPVDAGDPFVATLSWLLRHADGTDEPISVAQLAVRSHVNERTLRSWLAGKYPRRRATMTIQTLHLWAAEHVVGYPPESGSLSDLAGPPARRAATTDVGPYGAPSSENADGHDAASGTRTGPRWPKSRTTKAIVLSSVGVVLVAGVIGLTGAAAGWWTHSKASGTVSAASTPNVAQGLGGDTPTVAETAANRLGSPVYQDPDGTTVGATTPARIPYKTVVQVVCYAPNRTGQSSVTALYLIRGGTWNGLYAVSDTFTNGDPLGSSGPTNLDPLVPACPTPLASPS